MRVCDKCEGKPVVETIVKAKTEEEIDVCEKCLAEFEEFRRPIVKKEPEKRRIGETVGKKKDGAN
jgi:hypothetical protein